MAEKGIYLELKVSLNVVIILSISACLSPSVCMCVCVRLCALVTVGEFGIYDGRYNGLMSVPVCV